MTTPFRVGQRLTWRTYDGQLVAVTVIRPGPWRSLVMYSVDTYWARSGDMGPPKTVAKWRWNHRMFDQRAIDRATQEEAS